MKCRRLAILVIGRSTDPRDRVGLDGPQTAFPKKAIRRLANDLNIALDNIVDWENAIGHRGGNGGPRAVRLLSKGFGMSDIEIVRECDDGFPVPIDGATTVCARGETIGVVAVDTRTLSSRYMQRKFTKQATQCCCLGTHSCLR
ncbi:unnamed protein product [Ectocarpus sp. 13 AM-2016]